MTKIKTEMISLKVSDGTSMNAYAAFPDDDNKYPGLLLFQEAFGVNGHIKDLTERFSREGYVVISPELFHRTEPGFQGSYTDFPATKQHIQALTEPGLIADIKAAYSWLDSNSKVLKSQIGSTGYCMGGRVSVLANVTVPLKASASYYGGGIAATIADRLQNASGPLLLFWGGLDKHLGKDQIDVVTSKLDEYGKEYTNVVFSKADHGFFCDARASYNPFAAKQAWALTNAFFNLHLKV